VEGTAVTANSKKTANNKRRWSWKQPVCTECWTAIRVKVGRIEASWKLKHMFCCYCRKDIGQGVDTYAIRINPGTVPYPTVPRDEDEN
jgi:hypothetical protein